VSGVTPWLLLGVGADPAGAWPDGAVAIGEPARAVCADKPTAAAAPLLPLALATAARSAPEPPALLAPGVDAGRLNGLIALRVVGVAVLGPPDPPRGGKAAPPPVRAIGCQGVLMPDSAESAADAGRRVSQSLRP